MATRHPYRIVMKPGIVAWVRVRLAIVCMKLRWFEAMHLLLDGVWEVKRCDG